MGILVVDPFRGAGGVILPHHDVVLIELFEDLSARDCIGVVERLCFFTDLFGYDGGERWLYVHKLAASTRENFMKPC